jgi:hypothetical protein
MKNFRINCQLQRQPFFIVILHFLLVKAEVNALHICKLINDCLNGIQFLHFPIAKGGTRTIALSCQLQSG